MINRKSLSMLKRRGVQWLHYLVKRPHRLAVLIDGDGVSPADAKRVLDFVPELGRICIVRACGNFAGQSGASWAKLLRHHGLVVRHLPKLVPKKNATDIALTIDAMEILLTRRIDAFILIASDSDFAPLARRIREEARDVIGFGSKSSSEPFRRACTVFHDLRSSAWKATPNTSSPAHWSRSPSEAEDLVLQTLNELDWTGRPVLLSTLGHALARQSPGFNSRVYGRRSLRELVRELPSVDLVEEGGVQYARPAKSN